MCAKLSILSYYLLIFKVKPVFSYCCFAMMAFVILYSTGFFLANLFECTPLAKTFHPLTFKGHAHCLVIQKLIKTNGGFNIASDFLVLVLPVPLILKLQMDLRTKIGVLGIFSTGIFVWVMSIVRTVIVIQSLNAIDQTWEAVPDSLWLTAELDVGIICACLPYLAPLWKLQVLHHLIPESLRYYFKSRSQSNTSGSKSTKNSNGPAGAKGFQNIESDSALELVESRKQHKRNAYSVEKNIRPGPFTTSKIQGRMDENMEFSQV